MSEFPLGGIIFWPLGTDRLPPGWQICDGTNSTPDLQGRFIKGATTSSGTAGKIQESTFLTHRHGYLTFPFDAGASSMVGNVDNGGNYDAEPNGLTTDTKGVAIAGDDPLFDPKASPTESRAANIYLHCAAFTGKANPEAHAAHLPVGVVIAWAPASGAPLPIGWLQCDGKSLDATKFPSLHTLLKDAGFPFGVSGAQALLPDLGNRFVRGVQTPNKPSNGRPNDPDLIKRYAAKNPAILRNGLGSEQDADITWHHHGYGKFPPDNWSNQGASSVGGKHQFTAGQATSGLTGVDEPCPANVSLIHLIKAVDEPEGSPPPIGAIVMYAGGANYIAHMTGWQLCDGESASHRLKQILKTDNLPNLQGLFVRGVDPTGKVDGDRDATRFKVTYDASGKPNYVRSAYQGPLSLQFSAVGPHTHQIAIAVGAPVGGMGNPKGHYGITGWRAWAYPDDKRTDVFPAASDVGQTGHETRPKNLALYFLISSGLDAG